MTIPNRGLKEFFIVANSFAAPFCSDTSTHFSTAFDGVKALEKFAKRYSHPAGLFSAAAYNSAEEYHKGAGAVAVWVCNLERESEKVTKGLGAYSYQGTENGFIVNDVEYTVKNPREGYATPLTRRKK